MTTTPDPASPVAAALADADKAVAFADAARRRDDAEALSYDVRPLAQHVMILDAHIRTLAARDAKQMARMAALERAAIGVTNCVVYPDFDHVTHPNQDWVWAAAHRIEALRALLADAGDAQRETGDDE